MNDATLKDLQTRLDEINVEREAAEETLRSLSRESSAIHTLLQQVPQDPESSKKTRADYIREAMKRVKKGSAEQVAKEMENGGWNWNGTSGTAVVGVELNRFANMDRECVQRVKRGIFRYKE